MAEVTYYVALPFVATVEGIAVGEPTDISQSLPGCHDVDPRRSSRDQADIRRLN